MRKILFIVLGLFVSFAVAEARENVRSIGVGAMLGSPSGVSAKYGLSETTGIDAGFGITFGNLTDIHLHGDYLWHRNDLFTVENRPIDLYYGVGLRIRILDTIGSEAFRIGPRLPVGLRYVLPDPLLEFYAEVAFILDVIEAVDADVDFAFGARYYF